MEVHIFNLPTECAVFAPPLSDPRNIPIVIGTGVIKIKLLRSLGFLSFQIMGDSTSRQINSIFLKTGARSKLPAAHFELSILNPIASML